MIFSKAKYSKSKNEEAKKDPQQSLLDFLKDLERVESKLWGVNISELSNGEERILEDTNHLIYLISRENKHKELKAVLRLKDVDEFIKEVRKLKEDFQMLKKLVREENQLKLLITNYTIKLVNERNFTKLQRIFLLEKELNEIIERQEAEFEVILSESSKVKVDTEDERVEKFLESLYRLRKVLAGHLDVHGIWEEERSGYSRTSRIITEMRTEIQKV